MRLDMCSDVSLEVARPVVKAVDPVCLNLAVEVLAALETLRHQHTCLDVCIHACVDMFLHMCVGECIDV